MLRHDEYPLDLGHAGRQRAVRAACDRLTPDAPQEKSAARNEHVLRFEISVTVDLVVVDRPHLRGHCANERCGFGLAWIGKRNLEGG